MREIYIKPGCITCGACEFLAPEVFEVTDVSHVRTGVDADRYSDEVNLAIKTCPVQVIAVKDKEDNHGYK